MRSGSPSSLRVQIASDLHLEFYDELPRFEDLLRPTAPVLALLGDICALGHRRGCQTYEVFLQECCKRFECVLVLLGNHEVYSDQVSQVTCGAILSFLRGLAAKYPKVHFLENDGLTLNGVRVVGTALWSAVPEEQTLEGAAQLGLDLTSTVEYSMNDYRLVYVSDDHDPGTAHYSDVQDVPTPPAATGGIFNFSRFAALATARSGPQRQFAKRLARVRDTNAWHRAAVSFLETEAAEATQRGMAMLVLTHHTPSFRGTSKPEYGCDPRGMSSAFSTDLEHMLSDPRMAAIHTWCFGHTHYNSDQHISGRRLVSNQRGYPEHPCRSYRRDFVIEVPTAPAQDALGPAQGRAAAPHHACGERPVGTLINEV